MTKELVISVNRHETKVAVLEDDQLVEVHFQRANEYSLAGSIHKGRVTRVLPGMQSAFVDLGLERDAFLYVSDFFEESDEYERLGSVTDRPRRAEQRPAGAPAGPRPTGAPAEWAEEGDAGRDRRGRRSRRRRNRGRGFPEAKYTARGEADAVSLQERPEPVPPADEAIVLPGESLAKYRHLAEGAGVEAERETAPSEELHVPVEMLEAGDDFGAEEGLSAGEPGDEDVFGGEPLEAGDPEDTLDADAGLPLLSEAPVELEMETNGTAEGEETIEDAVPEEPESAVDDSDMDEVDDTGAGEPAEPDLVEAAEEALEAGLREEQPTARYVSPRPRRVRRRRGDGRPPGPQQPERRAAGQEGSLRSEQRTVSKAERPERPPQALITDLLKEGQEIIVQVAKEPLGQKGARITSHVALPGRFVVYMPTLDHLGVSRKVSSDEERQRLRRIIQTHSAGMPGGFIVRTAGEGRGESEIAADMTFLYNLWLEIREKAERKKAPCLLHHDLELVRRTLRDQVSDQFKAIWVDNEEAYESILHFMERFQPHLVHRVKLYTRPAPIFDAFNVTSELEKALRPKVWLKSGGYIVINQTEALVAIDVNTGKFVGKSNRLEDTIVKTNTEAVKEIARQIRLRDLGGIIVVDFIDMDERRNRQKVMQVLEEAMRADRAPNKLLQFNDFGLVAITRRRVKQSLERALCSPCAACEGAGYVKSVQTVIGEIVTEARKVAEVLEGKDVLLRVHPEVARILKSNEYRYLEELEEILKRPVLVKSDPLLHQEKFDLA